MTRLLDAKSLEALVEKVRVRLDCPEVNELAGYRDAVDALDRLAILAHALLARQQQVEDAIRLGESALDGSEPRRAIWTDAVFHGLGPDGNIVVDRAQRTYHVNPQLVMYAVPKRNGQE